MTEELSYCEISDCLPRLFSNMTRDMNGKQVRLIQLWFSWDSGMESGWTLNKVQTGLVCASSLQFHYNNGLRIKTVVVIAEINKIYGSTVNHLYRLFVEVINSVHIGIKTSSNGIRHGFCRVKPGRPWRNWFIGIF